MNDEQLTALAREYAEECAEEVGLPNCLQNETFGLVVTETECVIKWLLRRFCLAEKETVHEEYRKATADVAEAIKSKNPLSESCGKGKRLAIQSLFPEIAKEVE